MAKILICDDDPLIHKLVGSFLQREGHEVQIANDGIDALRLVKKDKPDIMVLDVMMPNMNGYDVCHSIKFDVKMKDIPILMLTTRTQELDPRLGVLMGIEYMHKSESPRNLVAKVNQMLAAKKPKS